MAIHACINCNHVTSLQVQLMYQAAPIADSNHEKIIDSIYFVYIYIRFFVELFSHVKLLFHYI